MATVTAKTAPKLSHKASRAWAAARLGLAAVFICSAIGTSALAQSVIDRAIGAGVIGPSGAEAAAEGQSGWTVRSGVALSATYSDNANLTGDDGLNGEAQEELFLQVLPYVSVEGEGARVKARGYYAPALYTGTIGDTSPSIANFLTLNGTVELSPDTFFLDGFARASMVNRNAGGVGGAQSGSYLYDTDDVTQAFAVGFSPYVLRHLGPTADFSARANLSTTLYSDSSQNNSVNGSFTAGFTSGRDFPRLPWSAYYSLRGLRFNDDSTAYGGSNTYQSITGETSYLISPVWRVDTSLGYENNDYTSTSGNKSGPTASLGGTWTPNPRLALSLGYGWKPYSDNWYLNYRYAHKRVSWNANFRTQLTTVQQEFLQTDTFVLTDPNGLPVIDQATGLPVLVTQVDPTLTNETYVLSTFSSGLNWTGNRTTVGLNVRWNQREYQVSDRDQTDWGVGARVTRTLSPDLRATARVDWTQYDSGANETGEAETQGNLTDYDRWNAGILLTKQLSERSSVSGIYDYRTNLRTDADTSAGDENRVTLVFNHTF